MNKVSGLKDCPWLSVACPWSSWGGQIVALGVKPMGVVGGVDSGLVGCMRVAVVTVCKKWPTLGGAVLLDVKAS